MTDEDAQQWVAEQFGDDASQRIDRFARLVVEENERQNLISPATVSTIWSRHIVDSLQLVRLGSGGQWLDIGTGGGFPGMVIGLVRLEPMLLVEPRTRRAAFLRHVVDLFTADHVRVAATKVEQVNQIATTISARAVASIENLLRAAAHCATPATRWLLPRGTIDRAELTNIAQRHRMMFHVEHSLTHPESSIVVMTQ